MTREQKLALIFAVVLILGVGVLLSDHLSSARKSDLGTVDPQKNSGPGQLEEPGLVRNLAFLEETNKPAMQPAAIIQTGINQPGGSAPIIGEPTPRQPEIKSASRDPFEALANKVTDAGRDLLNGQTPPPAVGVDRYNDVGRGSLGGDGSAAVNQVESLIRADGSRTHTIAEGDTLWSISAKYYGSGAAHKKLAAYNASRLGEGGELRIGASLLIPPAEKLGLASAAAETKPVAMEKETTATLKEPAKKEEKKDSPGSYTVRSGDTLAGIAKKTLGSAGRWEEILDLNRSVIDDETAVPAGTVLKLPKR